jgi:hypothetical protein
VTNDYYGYKAATSHSKHQVLLEYIAVPECNHHQYLKTKCTTITVVNVTKLLGFHLSALWLKASLSEQK